VVLPGVGEAVEIHHHGHLEAGIGDFRHVVCDEVMVLQWRNRQIKASHSANLLSPKTASIDHMLGDDRAFFRNHIPGVVWSLVEFHNPVVLDHIGAPVARAFRISMDHACCVHITFPVRPHAAEDAVRAHYRASSDHLVDIHQVDILDAHGLEYPVGGL